MKDFCMVCGKEVPEGKEHDYQKHGSARESAEQLVKWKAALKETGAHLAVIDGGTF